MVSDSWRELGKMPTARSLAEGYRGSITRRTEGKKWERRKQAFWAVRRQASFFNAKGAKMAERNAKEFRKSFTLSALKKEDGELDDGLLT